MQTTTVKISSVTISVIFLMFTVICGLWLEFSGNPVQKSDLAFHFFLAVISIVSVYVSFYILTKN